ncbi:hypothetical protein OEZ86_004113 [Tetradesmus obliquus]|nr:hypothetical protein OEZ86_004113 [Tetradesmus obliquus]
MQPALQRQQASITAGNRLNVRHLPYKTAAVSNLRPPRQQQQQRCAALLAQSLRTDVAAPPSKDVTASVMRTVMELSLKNRLAQYRIVQADVACDAMGLLDGRFDALSIEGRHWVTPLNMTAHRLEVDIGTMQVDTSALLWQQKVRMSNVPAGRVRIHLSGKDMGNFVCHPLFRAAAATAVHGQSFLFDKDSVVINHSSNSVHFSGTWGANGERYRLVMLPGKVGPGGVRGQLQVGAQHICSSSSSSSSNDAPQAAGQQQQQQQQQAKPATDLQGAQMVASGMAKFFSSLSLDLQGIELRQPLLSLHAGDVSDSKEGDLLEIELKLRLRAFPPLDMQF